MILLEGQDCVGKSTTALALRKALARWSYRHHTRPPQGVPVFAYHSWGVADAHPRLILDRLHWSGYAYDEVYREGRHGYSHAEWRMMELLLMSRGTHVIFLTDDLNAITGRWRASQQAQMYPPHVQDLDAAFKQVMSVGNQGEFFAYRSYLPFHVTTLPDITRTHRAGTVIATEFMETLTLIADDAAHAAKAFPPTVGIGNLRPDFVFLGEAGGNTLPTGLVPPGLPFFRGPAMDYAWEKFMSIDLQWWRGYYTNANAFVAVEEFAYYFNEIVTPKVIVAFGDRAGGLATAAKRDRFLRPDISVALLEHPSYIARFHRHDNSWTERLGEIMQQYRSVA